MYAYDLVKRNKCVITIGETPHSGFSMIDPEASQAAGMRVDCAAPEHGSVSVPCYFLKPPDFSFSSEFSEANDLVSTMLGGISEAFYTANLALPALDSLSGGMDEAMDAAGSIVNTLGQSHEKHANEMSKEKFDAEKRQAVIGALRTMGRVVGNAGSQETKTFRLGKVMDWKGSNPVDFTLEVLFCKPNSGVYAGVLYPLIEASSYSKIAFANYLYGPRGYNSAGFGVGAIGRILNGEFKSLHSLRLWYSADDEFTAETKDGNKPHIILDLFRLLVITSLKIDRSEQLFFDPSKPNSAPMYKWLKATIGFKTACPIPGSLWAVKGTGARPLGSNASLHDFYGSTEAPYMDGYPDPISDQGVNQKEIPSYKDMGRLINNDPQGFRI